MKEYRVGIVGTSQYMQHRMDDLKLEDWEKKRGAIMERDDVAHADAVRAEFHCYRNDKGQCYIPADQIKGALIGAGSYVKAKVGGRSKSMKTLVAAAFEPTPDQIIMPDYTLIDKRSAVNKNIKARVMVIRPKWQIGWKAEFTLRIYEDSITTETIEQILQYAGSYVGIGSFRPTNNGMFGKFEVEDLQKL